MREVIGLPDGSHRTEVRKQSRNVSTAPEVTVQVEHLEGECVVRLKGELREGQLSSVRDAISRAVGLSTQRVLMNLKGVAYLSSAGIGMLLSVLKLCRANGVGLALCDLDEEVRELFRVTQLDQVFALV